MAKCRDKGGIKVLQQYRNDILCLYSGLRLLYISLVDISTEILRNWWAQEVTREIRIVFLILCLAQVSVSCSSRSQIQSIKCQPSLGHDWFIHYHTVPEVTTVYSLQQRHNSGVIWLKKKVLLTQRNQLQTITFYYCILILMQISFQFVGQFFALQCKITFM